MTKEIKEVENQVNPSISRTIDSIELCQNRFEEKTKPIESKISSSEEKLESIENASKKLSDQRLKFIKDQEGLQKMLKEYESLNQSAQNKLSSFSEDIQGINKEIESMTQSMRDFRKRFVILQSTITKILEVERK